MRRSCVVLGWVLIAAFAAQGQEPPADDTKRGSEILAAAAKATGGEALGKIERLEFTSSGEVHGPMGALAVEVKVKVAFPDRIRLSTALSMGVIDSGFDGKAAWLSSPQGSMPLPPEMQKESLRGIALTAGIGLYQAALAGKAQARFTGEREFNGTKSLEVEWAGPSGDVKLYFDARTNLLIGARYTALTMQGSAQEERRWSDFRAVDGVQFPYRWETYRDGALYSSQTVSAVKFNPTFDAAIFTMP